MQTDMEVCNKTTAPPSPSGRPTCLSRLGIGVFALFLGGNAVVFGLPNAGAAPNVDTGASLSTDAYQILYFYEKEQVLKEIAKARGSVEKTWEGLRVESVKASDANVQDVVRKCGVTRVPYTTVLAPNGAITARFTGIAGPELLRRAFVSPKMAELLKAVQAEKIVFLRVAGTDTEQAGEVATAVEQAARKLAGIAAVIPLDPTDEREDSLLKQINVAPRLNATTTLVIAPTGIIVERFTGAVTERELFDSFQKILSMSGGCGAATATGGSACDPGAGAGSHAECD